MVDANHDVSPVAPRSIGDLHSLLAAELLDKADFRAAVRWVRDGRWWRRWAGRTILAFAVLHILAGIVFFFAYNWSAIPDFGKFALVQGTLVIAAGVALWRGPETTVGRIAAAFASVMVGVLLAVFGQIYQTGADAYELFFGWSLLILLWVIAGSSAWLWLLWACVLSVALVAYRAQFFLIAEWWTEAQVLVLLGGFWTLLLVIREVAAAGGVGFLAPNWTRFVTLAVALAILFAAGMVYVVDRRPPEIAGLLALAGLIAGVYGYFRRHRRDPAAAALAASTLLLFASFAGAYLLVSEIGYNAATLLFAAAWVVVQMSVLVFWLRRLLVAETASAAGGSG